MGRVSLPSTDVHNTLKVYTRGGHLLPNYMFTPPHRQHGILYKTVAGPGAQEFQELLRTNMLFNWLTGEYGPIDDFTITKGDVENMYEEIIGFPLVHHLIHNGMVVGKELKFWDHMLNGDKRVLPLKPYDPPKYPVMIESEDSRATKYNKSLKNL